MHLSEIADNEAKKSARLEILTLALEAQSLESLISDIKKLIKQS